MPFKAGHKSESRQGLADDATGANYGTENGEDCVTSDPQLHSDTGRVLLLIQQCTAKFRRA